MPFNVGSIIAILLGVLTGLYVAIIIIVNEKSKKLVNNFNIAYDKKITDEQIEEISNVINVVKKENHKDNKQVVKKVIGLKKNKSNQNSINYVEIVKNVSYVFNSESVAPLFELSEKQVFYFCHKIIDDVKALLKIINLPFVYEVKLSQVLGTINVYKSVTDKKIVKHGKKVVSVFLTVINFINPFYWIKRFIQEFVSAKMLNNVFNQLIDIVAIEFANIYCGVDHKEISTYNQVEEAN